MFSKDFPANWKKKNSAPTCVAGNTRSDNWISNQTCPILSTGFTLSGKTTPVSENSFRHQWHSCGAEYHLPNPPAKALPPLRARCSHVDRNAGPRIRTHCFKKHRQWFRFLTVCLFFFCFLSVSLRFVCRVTNSMHNSFYLISKLSSQSSDWREFARLARL